MSPLPQLPDELRERLDEHPIRGLAEYLDWSYREGTVELVFASGNLARAYLKAGQVRIAELEELGAHQMPKA